MKIYFKLLYGNENIDSNVIEIQILMIDTTHPIGMD